MPTIAIPFWVAAIIWFICSYSSWNQHGQRFFLGHLFTFVGCIAFAFALCRTELGPMPPVIVLVLSTTWVFGKIAAQLLRTVYRAGRKRARPELFLESDS